MGIILSSNRYIQVLASQILIALHQACIVYSENKMNWWLARATGDHPGKASSYELNLFYIFHFNAN